MYLAVKTYLKVNFLIVLPSKSTLLRVKALKSHKHKLLLLQ